MAVFAVKKFHFPSIKVPHKVTGQARRQFFTGLLWFYPPAGNDVGDITPLNSAGGLTTSLNAPQRHSRLPFVVVLKVCKHLVKPISTI